MEANGSVTGERQDQFVEGPNTADVNGAITGKVSIKGRVPTGTLKETGTVTGVFQSQDYTGTAKGSSTVTLDVSSSNVVTTGEIKISPKGGQSVTFAGTETYPLSTGVNGDWNLDTDITATADKLSGTGTLTLDTGRAFTYQVIGSYSTSSGVAKLKLVGESDAIGSSLSLTTQGTEMSLTALKGKVLGQKPTVP